MASTRNKNTKCDYNLQQQAYRQNQNYNLFKNSQYGSAYNNAFPEFYYTPSHLPRQFYTENSIDIESALKGINSTNLVNEPELVVPVFKPIMFDCFFEHSNRVLLPQPLFMEPNQRPQFN